MPNHRHIRDLTNGESVDSCYLVADKQVRSNRQGGLYLYVDLRDRTGIVNARLWNVTEHQTRAFEPGDFVHVVGKVQVFQGAPQIILSRVTRVEPADIGLDASEYLPRSPRDVETLSAKLRAHLMSVEDPHLRALAESFLMDDRFLADFSAVPAGIRAHHAHHAGLLEHVVNMLDVVSRIADLYPDVNRDLWILGVFLHDVGKVRELSHERGFAYTDEGQLVGHIVIGVEILAEKARAAAELTGEPFPEELLLRLKHVILSHHGALEYGSPRLPMTPEAVAVHYLDNLDAKLHTFARDIRDDPNRESRWTPFDSNLNRKLYKGRPPADSDEPAAEDSNPAP